MNENENESENEQALTKLSEGTTRHSTAVVWYERKRKAKGISEKEKGKSPRTQTNAV